MAKFKEVNAVHPQRLLNNINISKKFRRKDLEIMLGKEKNGKELQRHNGRDIRI